LWAYKDKKVVEYLNRLGEELFGEKEVKKTTAKKAKV
jgi:hypothetical protein